MTCIPWRLFPMSMATRLPGCGALLIPMQGTLSIVASSRVWW
jgi:hypothetical protein